MDEILEFISVFRSAGTEKLFTECACYWFAKILQIRFGGTILYDPNSVHFATMIDNKIYDINGIEDAGDYVIWNCYKRDDRDLVERCCIYLKGGE